MPCLIPQQIADVPGQCAGFATSASLPAASSSEVCLSIRLVLSACGIRIELTGGVISPMR